MNRLVPIALIASFCVTLTVRADEPDATTLPAVKKALDKADSDVTRNRKAFDEANAKAYAEAEKALKAEADRLSKVGKPEEAVAVKELLEELKTKLVAGEPSPRKKEDPKKPVRRRKAPNPAMVGAVPWNGHHYKVILEPMSWKQAQQWCEDNGGHLVIIENKEENDALVKWLTRPGGPTDVWIGATDEKNEGQWLWVDGKPVGFSNWKQREPDNNGANGDAHYVQLNVLDLGTWNDVRLIDKGPFVCEWDE